MSRITDSASDLLATAFPLRKGRVHEACGAGAVGFAAILAAVLPGDILWVTRTRVSRQINPDGLTAFCDPARILTATCPGQTNALAVTEEALRSSAVSLVVTEIGHPLSLTAGRRLQLAARAGQATGLCLIPEGMGSNAAETRWHCAPLFEPEMDSTLMHWRLIKNKSGTFGVWNVRWSHKTHRLDVVSAPGK